MRLNHLLLPVGFSLLIGTGVSPAQQRYTIRNGKNDEALIGAELLVKELPEITERVRAGRLVVSGDTVTVELLSIDKATYDYFNTLRDILSSDRAATSLSPANPNTNLSGGALGYFAAWAIDRKVIILQ